MIIHGIETSSDEICQSIVVHCLQNRVQVFEKIKTDDGGDTIVASIFCVIGIDAEEFTGLVREWLHNKGYS